MSQNPEFILGHSKRQKAIIGNSPVAVWNVIPDQDNTDRSRVMTSSLHTLTVGCCSSPGSEGHGGKTVTTVFKTAHPHKNPTIHKELAISVAKDKDTHFQS